VTLLIGWLAFELIRLNLVRWVHSSPFDVSC
jgi:hypothetical protein